MPVDDTAKIDESDITALTTSPLTRVLREVATAMTSERPMTDVGPQYVEHSRNEIAQTDAYYVQTVFCSNSGENPTIVHPLESRGTAPNCATDAASERCHPMHSSLMLPPPQTDRGVIRLPADQASTLRRMLRLVASEAYHRRCRCRLLTTLVGTTRLVRCRRSIHQ